MGEKELNRKRVHEIDINDTNDWFKSLTIATTPTLIHVADVDTGGIRWINDDCIEQICMPITSLFVCI